MDGNWLSQVGKSSQEEGTAWPSGPAALRGLNRVGGGDR